jgi:hypothetical protein
MRNLKYLLAGVAIGSLMWLPQALSANPLAAGLASENDITPGLVEKVHTMRYNKHRYSHRRRHNLDDDFYYPYSYYPSYCHFSHGYCGDPRHYRRPCIAPQFGFGFGF